MTIRSGVVTVVAGVVLLSASAVWAQAAKGKPVTVTGRVVDNVCMLTMGLKGEGHRECAIGCDKTGVRMSLLDEKANQLYAVIADKPFVDPNSLIRPHFERIVTVKGDLYDAPGGQKVLAVKEVTPAPAGGAKSAGAAKNPCAAGKM